MSHVNYLIYDNYSESRLIDKKYVEGFYQGKSNCRYIKLRENRKPRDILREQMTLFIRNNLAV